MDALTKKTLVVGLMIALIGAATILAEQQSAPVPVPVPVPAPSAAPVKPAVITRTREQAMSALMALPELVAWSRQIEKTHGTATRARLIEYDSTPKLIAGKRYWQLSFVESSNDAVHHWESFLVAESGDEILVEDPAGDGQLTLEQWRKEQRPLERTAPPAAPN